MIDDETTVVIIGYGTQRFGVIVDGVDAAEEIVVKPLSPVLRGIKLFGGSAVLGDGGLALILDHRTLAATAGARTTPVQPRTVVPLPALPSLGAMMLVFRAGHGAPKAVPLGAIQRIEDIAAVIESDGVLRLPYHGGLVPLHRFGVQQETVSQGRVLVAIQDGKRIGFIADEVVDSVAEVPSFNREAAQPGILGVATIAGVATEIVDIAYYAACFGAVSNDRSAA